MTTILKTINPREEVEIKRIRDAQRRLHLIPTPVCYLNVESKDKAGMLVAKYEDRSKSWVRNFYNWMCCQQMTCNANILGTSYGAGYLTEKITTGGIQAPSYPTHLSESTVAGWWGFRANGSITTHGILIGTNDTPSAESFDDYKLDTLIEEGVGSGQMQYAGMAVPTPVWDGGGKTMTLELQRSMVNNSLDEGTIGVNEIGLAASFRYGVYSYNFLMARDVLASTVNVVHEGQITVTYTIVITYPA